MTQGNSIDKVELRKTYYSSGALWIESPYVNGQRHGMVKRYYETGVLRCETPYVNGKIHGIERLYYESGALEWEAPYVNGEMHGIGKHYNREKSNIDRLTLYNKDRILLSLRCES